MIYLGPSSVALAGLGLYIAYADFIFKILLPQPTKCWDYRHTCTAIPSSEIWFCNKLPALA